MLLDESRREQWNDFVRASEYPNAMQSWEWGELKATTGWKPMVVAVEDGGKIVAGAMILRRQIPRIGRCLLYAPRGPVLDWSDADLFARLVGEIRTTAARVGGVALKIDPPVPADRADVVPMLERHGFRFTGDDDPDLGGTQPRYVLKTDLTPDLDELLASFHSKWRYNIRLAERRGVSVREGTREDLPEFYDRLQHTAGRDGFRVRGYDYYEAIFDLLVPAGLAKLFITEFEGRIIGGAVLFRMGDEAVYVYGASQADYHKQMPNHLLQWEMMQWAKANGCRTYDFRGVSKEVDGEPLGELGGLNRFKRGFNAQYTEYIGEYDLVLSPLWYRLYRLAMRARG
ncbi:MAG: peptidoglycan bridge formation glycyltransferase FemA/FemB family protein [candidate division WS1 bacterium]|jgi:lipid II:glycine glycyltransferase (peptidoglycan interpeptide bridge formation enzyme)|nr:peptidoglycan bridge formation glycyltransferase FemA/FemB family protein [candidate division WS1 bacterium]